MASDRAQLQDWSRLIRAEYDELPDLRLKQSQIEELWGLDPTVAEALLDALVAAAVLTRTPQGAYMRADGR